jgi:PAS domain S-box-containing protein
MTLMALHGLRRSKPGNSEKIEHERLTSLINSMADAVLALDEDLRVVLYNAAALNIFDLNNIKTGTPIEKLFTPIDKNNQPVALTPMIQKASLPMTSRDLRLKYADGSAINLYISIAPVHLGYGKKGDRGHVLLLRDITHEKSLEEERDEFISVVSHELRTPLAIAEGNISNAQFVAKKLKESTDITQALENAHKQILFLADLINDLSTLSRAERGKLQVEVEKINIQELLDDLGRAYTPNAASKGLLLTLKPLETPVYLESGRLYLREILQNFITNAIKYTDSGGVEVSARPEEHGVTFIVKDTGIGISKGDQERVFDKFFRSEDFRTRKANGTGLGLYVTAKLSRLLHAEIKLDSELNKGSAFSIYVPHLS